jgi:hypothetical protein
MKYRSDDIVKSCRRLESGIRLGREGALACQYTAIASPIFWTADQLANTTITKDMIVEKRKWLFEALNDDHSDVTCKRCHMVRTKRFADVSFTKLGQIDLAANTICNLRCNYCGFTHSNWFFQSKYDDLGILKVFTPEDAGWDAVVDFNGGEPSILPNLDEYLDFFASRRIRIRFITNAVVFKQSVYDGLANGSIQWAVTSLDAGTPSTFLGMKERDYYLRVLENLTRYAHAGSQGGGMLAVKYIFCQDNCSDDDIAGFVYAMLAIRPQQIWLTFDFCHIYKDYDYRNESAAYAKMYNMFRKHGITPVHYTTGHLAAVCQEGKNLLKRTLNELESITPDGHPTELKLKNFRSEESREDVQTPAFYTTPLRIAHNAQTVEPWSLNGKTVLIAPACFMSVDILSNPDIKASGILGFLDRDKVIRNKLIQGYSIYGHESVADLNPDYVLVVAPGQHRADIAQDLAKHIDTKKIIVYEGNEL